MFDAVRSLFAARSLAEIDGTGKVDIEATVAQRNDEVSPLTGLRAAFFRHEAYVRILEPAGATRDWPSERQLPVGTRESEGALLLESGGLRVWVPAAGRELRLAEVSVESGMLVQSLPEAWSAWLEHPHTAEGRLFVRERFLSMSDGVRLVAHVERCRPGSAGPYRSGGEGDEDFIVRPDLGPVVIHERSP